MRRFRLTQLHEPLLNSTAAEAYEIAFDAARTMRTHFPDFYTAFVAPLAVTHSTLLGVCCALWRLVERAGLPLRWPDVGEGCYGESLGDDADRDPVVCLTQFGDVMLDYLDNYVLRYAMGPAPRYYGIGVAQALDTDWDQTDALTVTLWHLLQHTPWSVGIDPEALLRGVDDDLAQQLRSARPVAAATPLHLLAKHLTLPPEVDAAPFDLLAYSVGQTDNDLANHTEYEIEVAAIELGDEELWSWDDLPTLIAQAHAAQRLEQAYATWRRVISDGGLVYRERVITDLVRQIHRAERRAITESSAPPKTLIAILDDTHAPARETESVAML